MPYKLTLTGPRLSLLQTLPSQEMAETIYNAVDANREHLRPFCPWEKFDDSIKNVMVYLEQKQIKVNEGERVEYGIFISDTEEYIGNIQVFKISKENKSGEFGYWLTKSSSGNGYMAEAVSILEKECFENLGLNRIVIACDVRNKRSEKVMKACGYIYEGMLREDMYDPEGDTMRSTLVYSKLKAEYQDSLELRA